MTKDTASIKRVYQNLIARHHPEEDPQGFMRLHQAYKTALAYAKGTSSTQYPSGETVWYPQNTPVSREETGYDSLFADLSREKAADLSQQKRDFSRQLLLLKLHWLPIPLKSWKRFFSSEVFLLCRGEPECMEKLFALLVGKIHTYSVFRFLFNRLWELDGWLKSEGKEELAGKARKCIAEMSKQYSHYMKLNMKLIGSRIFFPVLWYYEALPFYFKLLVSTFLIPLLSFGSGEFWALLLLCFYLMELYLWIMKMTRQLGIFHPTPRIKRGNVYYKSIGDSTLFAFITMFAIIMQLGCCVAIAEAIIG